jgi:ubiquinone/menaquinone biosynthesis C-methylase UbiE
MDAHANIKNVGQMLESSHDEVNRQRFVSVLRKRILVDFAKDMRTIYEKKVAPQYRRKHGREPKDGREIRGAMLHEPVFEAWSSLRYNAQYMTWWSVQTAVERQLPEIIQAAKDAHAANPADGTLRLDPKLEIPGYVSQLDVHQMPGCFQTEYTKDDVAQGAVYFYGTTVFSGGLAHRRGNKGSVAQTIAQYLRMKGFKPKRILDMGCTAGSNTLPYKEIFPEAEVYGIDVAAPCLRFGHARAEAEGRTVHFSQQNAEKTNFPDNHFDLISSSFFFHELSVPATKNVLRECYRILKPGGLMLHMELPPSALTDPYYNFYLDWDAFYNNEPHYEAFRNLDFPKTLVEAGFKKKNLEMIRIPNFATTPEKEFRAVVKGTGKTGRRDHGGGAVWFTFGGWK